MPTIRHKRRKEPNNEKCKRNILEPSCGTGNFIGMVPDKMQNSKFFGVELDSLTGQIH